MNKDGVTELCSKLVMIEHMIGREANKLLETAYSTAHKDSQTGQKFCTAQTVDKKIVQKLKKVWKLHFSNPCPV